MSSEEIFTPERLRDNDEYDYSNEIKKKEKNGESFQDLKKPLVYKFNTEEMINHEEVKIIPFYSNEEKTTQYPSFKKLYQIDDEKTLIINKTNLNEYYKFIFTNFFTKKEMLQFIKHLSRDNNYDFDFSLHIDIRRVSLKTSKNDVMSVCIKLLDILSYK